jgi:hypothetical protein
MGILPSSMAKQILTLAQADDLANLLAQAPEKPKLQRSVDLDAFVQRLYPVIAKKMDEDGWTREECVAFLREHIKRSPIDVQKAIARYETTAGVRKANGSKKRGAKPARVGRIAGSGRGRKRNAANAASAKADRDDHNPQDGSASSSPAETDRNEEQSPQAGQPVKDSFVAAAPSATPATGRANGTAVLAGRNRTNGDGV